MARYEIPPGYVIGLIASMPRSGTWYSYYFLEFMDLYLSGRERLSTRLDLEIYASMRLAKIQVHTICPGFEDVCTGPERQRWDALHFYVPGYNFGHEKFIAGNAAVYSPATNRDVRIVYLCRNPLDHCVSYFRHAQHNQNAMKRAYVDESGHEVPIRNTSHFLRTVGLEAFVKQYYTFHVMRARFPDNVLMVSYEDLVRTPSQAFEQMLAHFGFRLDDAQKRTCFSRALNSTSVDSLRNIEKAIGATLARDQADAGESHMRGGEIGKWKGHLDATDLEFARAGLASFGLDLEAFTLE